MPNCILSRYSLLAGQRAYELVFVSTRRARALAGGVRSVRRRRDVTDMSRAYVSRRRALFALPVAVSTLLCACGATQLTVQVEPPPEAARSGFHVVLASTQDRCPLGQSALTDAAGRVQVTHKDCGPMQLMVGARGYEPSRQLLDTCRVKQVNVEMHSAAPVKLPTDECSRAALRVVEAWLSAEPAELQKVLLRSDDVELYLRGGDQPTPWQLDIHKTERHRSQCSVFLRLFYESGCVEPWRLELQRHRGRWLAKDLQRLTP